MQATRFHNVTPIYVYLFTQVALILGVVGVGAALLFCWTNYSVIHYSLIARYATPLYTWRQGPI